MAGSGDNAGEGYEQNPNLIQIENEEGANAPAGGAPAVPGAPTPLENMLQAAFAAAAPASGSGAPRAAGAAPGGEVQLAPVFARSSRLSLSRRGTGGTEGFVPLGSTLVVLSWSERQMVSS